jgi:hypothetical protein
MPPLGFGAVQELLGHSSYGITADIYSHVAVEQQREAAERLREAFPWMTSLLQTLLQRPPEKYASCTQTATH